MLKPVHWRCMCGGRNMVLPVTCPAEAAYGGVFPQHVVGACAGVHRPPPLVRGPFSASRSVDLKSRFAPQVSHAAPATAPGIHELLAVLLQVVSMQTDNHLSLCLSRRCAQADCGVMTSSLAAAAEPAGPSAAAAACCAVGAMASHGRQVRLWKWLHRLPACRRAMRPPLPLLGGRARCLRQGTTAGCVDASAGLYRSKLKLRSTLRCSVCITVHTFALERATRMGHENDNAQHLSGF